MQRGQKSADTYPELSMTRILKIKLYMTVIRPLLLCGAECWTVGKKEEQILKKAEIRMLRRIKGVTLRQSK